jgi:two-component system, OmpR family, response regulator VicR
MGLRILAVDDDDSLLEIYRLLLEDEGYEVFLSPTVIEDVSDVEQLHPDLVLLDVKISQADDGLTMLDQLRSHPATSSLPVILCTAASARTTRERIEDYQQQGVPVVYKPFKVEELLQTIKGALLPRGENEDTPP